MDLLPTIGAFLVALGASYALLRRSRPGRRWRLGFALASAALTALFVTGLALHRPPPPEAAVTDRPIEVLAPDYVSSSACKACHPAEYATWEGSYHSSMTQVATPEAVLGDFDDVELRDGPWVFRLLREGDGFWVDMPEIDWLDAGPAGPRVRRRIVLATGSHHMQAYWYSAGTSRVLGLLPFVYNLELRHWTPRAASFIRPPAEAPESELGRWNKTCLECHVTLGRLRPFDPDGQDTHVAEFGIACESCHGPAAEHVAANGSPARRYAAHMSEAVADANGNVVHPARLPHERSAEVCGQCHSTSLWTSQAAIDDWMEHGFRYRPGDRLADTKAVVRGRYEWNTPEVRASLAYQPNLLKDTFWSDGMNRVSGREYNGLLETPCFKRGEMSCLSCHAMHKRADDPRSMAEWANDQLQPGMRGNRACLQCHDEFAAAARLEAHTYHEAGSSGSLCYNCHMPHTSYGLLKAIRSHQIDSPSVQVSVDTRRPNACNQCHLDRTLAWTAEHLQDWYGIPAPALDRDEREIAASVLWLLRGDAGQRALMAWSMAWPPAREVAGDDWQGFYLGVLLADPYDAVRYIAYRSLRQLPGLGQMEYDFTAPQAGLEAAGNRALATWYRQRGPEARTGDTILIDALGRPRMGRILEVLGERDDRPVFFAE